MEKPVRDNNLAHKFEDNAPPNRPVLSRVDGGRQSPPNPLDEIIARKPKRQHIREFGSVIAFAAVLIAAYKLYHSGNLNTILALCAFATVFQLLCALTPALMHPVFNGWMRFAKVLEVVMTRVILGLMWIATFLPVGVAFKLIGKKTMTIGFEPERASYWEDCSKSRNDFALLERQY